MGLLPSRGVHLRTTNSLKEAFWDWDQMRTVGLVELLRYLRQCKVLPYNPSGQPEILTLRASLEECFQDLEVEYQAYHREMARKHHHGRVHTHMDPASPMHLVVVLITT